MLALIKKVNQVSYFVTFLNVSIDCEKGKVNKLTGSARKINKNCGGRRKSERRVSPGEIKSQSLVVVVLVVVLALLQCSTKKTENAFRVQYFY